jgi:hypothetical protein
MRYVLPGVILLCIPMVAVLDRRAIVIPVVAAGVLVQLLAVSVSPANFLILVRTLETQREALWVTGTNRIDFGDLWFNPNYSQIEGNWILLRYLLHIPPEPGRPDDAAKVGTRLSDAIPSQAWSAAARWDFIWNLQRSTIPVNASQPAPPGASAPVQ